MFAYHIAMKGCYYVGIKVGSRTRKGYLKGLTQTKLLKSDD